MHSPALAIGWELWARHRWGLSALGAGALAAAVLVRVLPADAAQIIRDVAQTSVLFIYIYLLWVFVYAEGTLGGKLAGFPRRLFTLPVGTDLLVAWPMLYGMAAVALLWLWLVWLIPIPVGRSQTVPLWPSLLLAACLACFQAVCWTLVWAPLLRLVVAILGLPSAVMAAALIWARNDVKLTSGQVALALCAIIGTAYLVAVAGVARDRRGDRWNWAWLGRLLLRAVPGGRGRARPFASAQAAQRWLEVRRHAWLLPVFVAFFLAMLFWAAALPLSRQEVAQIAAAIVAVPAVLAFFIGFGMGKTSFWARDLRLSSFVATRPVTSAALANAKLQVAGLSALATWGIVLLLAPLWAFLSGNVEAVRGLCAAWFHDQPGWKLGLLAPLALVGLVGLTWLQTVAGMALSLTGRAAIVNCVVLLYVAVGTLLAGLGAWTAAHADFLDTLVVVLWWLGGGLGLLKLGAAAWAWSRPGFWREQAVGRLILWLMIAACLLVPLYTLTANSAAPAHLITLFVGLALPLTRLTALPAAVAWNRHR
jgi:hypothetical protein